VELKRDQVQSYPWFGLAYYRRSRAATTPGERLQAWLWGGKRFCELVVADGLGPADVVYAFSSAALPLFCEARAKDRACILDHATAPLSWEMELLTEERRRFEGWEQPVAEAQKAAAAYTSRQREECARADLVLCASTYMSDVVGRTFDCSAKCRMVPLGFMLPSGTVSRDEERSGPLHVLTVGNGGLLKGWGYLAQVAASFDRSEAVFRAVGNIALTDKGMRTLAESVDCVGSVPRGSMDEQYQWADVLLVPSVSETFGLVILEAMSRGVPVVASAHSAAPDLLRDGVDGYVVAARDVEGFVESLRTMINDRGLSRKMSRAVRERASVFSMKAYGERLAAVVDEVRKGDDG
jgi:glycosyltransferase involved in cell wall biosynthesis